MRISASRVSAVCGYNPFAELHPLFLDILYQDHDQRSLDEAVIGLRLLSREDEMEQLLSQAARAGGREAAAAAALSTVMQSGGSAQTAAGVQDLTRKAAALIAGLSSVSAPQRAMLESGAASALNTAFGTRHEAEALGLYERRTGCAVRRRLHHQRRDYVIPHRHLHLRKADRLRFATPATATTTATIANTAAATVSAAASAASVAATADAAGFAAIAVIAAIGRHAARLHDGGVSWRGAPAS